MSLWFICTNEYAVNSPVINCFKNIFVVFMYDSFKAGLASFASFDEVSQRSPAFDNTVLNLTSSRLKPKTSPSSDKLTD